MTGVGSALLKKWIETKVALTRGDAIKAKCADCMSDYADGRLDCEIYDCPLYPYMPYKKVK